MFRKMKYFVAVTIAILVQILYFLYSTYSATNNSCKTFRDYYTNRDQNENCYYNPDYNLTVPEIIQRYGYVLETHNVTTSDDYILTLFRIPSSNSANKKGKPILLLHGFASSSASFFGKGKESLGFLLSDAGYDVWVGNFRGSKYSQSHKYLNELDGKYWDFSFHENGIYDIPAFTDFIVNKTEQKIIIVGYSLGAASNYVYASTYPELASKQVEIFISIAPAPFLINIGYPMRIFLSGFNYMKDALPFDKVTISKDLKNSLCMPYPFLMDMCYWSTYYSSGYYYKHIDPETFPNVFQHMFDVFSTKNLAHFSQLHVYGDSQQYYYNPSTNLKIYGSEEPPRYNFSKVTVPSYIIRVKDDTLVTKEGVEELYRRLPKKFVPYDIYVIKVPHFSHADILFGKDAETIVYKHVIDFLGTR